MPPSALSSPDLLTTLKPARKLSLLVQNSPLAMIEWNQDLIVQGWNPAAAELFNFFEDEAIGRRLDELLAERQIADLGLDDWQRCDPAGILRSHANMTGKKVCRWYNTPFIVKGQQIGTLATIVDVTHQTALSNEALRAQLQSRTRVLKHTTERLQQAMSDRTQCDVALQAQLQSSRTFLKDLINAIAAPLFIKDDNHQITLFNDAFCQFVGRSREALVGKRATDIFCAAEGNLPLPQAVDDDDVQTTCFTDASGEIKHVCIATTRFQGLDNQPYWLSFIRDITQQSIAQKALQESEDRLEKIFAKVPGMLYQFCLSVNLTPSFPFVSSSSQTLLELSPEQIQADASTILNLIHAEDRATFDRSVALSSQKLTDWHWQGRFVLPSGRTAWMQAASRPEKKEDGSTVWDGLLVDITNSKEAESALQRSEARLRSQTQQLKAALKQLRQTQAKLIQSEKMSSLGQLVAGIAHEINNPVSFIHGNLTYAQGYIQDMLKVIRLYQAHYPTPIREIQVISEELELDYVLNDLPKLLQSVQAGANRIHQIVLSLRNFSRLDESELKQADIHEGIESTLMILGSRIKATASRHAIEVVKAYENIPPVECYVSQLNQVFMNILVNAIDAIDSASEANKIYQIVLQTFQKKGYVVVRITNNGPPIPKDTARRMFDPFFTTKPVGHGTGMGLAISYQTIVDLHKGGLEHSQTEDRKTVFTIEIPTDISPSHTACR